MPRAKEQNEFSTCKAALDKCNRELEENKNANSPINNDQRNFTSECQPCDTISMAEKNSEVNKANWIRKM
jgi:hypothetical protein